MHRLMRCGAIAACLMPWAPLARQSPAPTKPTEACAALEAAYIAANERPDPAQPMRAQPSTRVLELGKLVDSYKQQMGLGLGEFEGLLAHEKQANRSVAPSAPAFVPHCDWKAKLAGAKDNSGHVMTAEFTPPILSSDRKLALVEVSFIEPGWGYGKMCVVRRTGEIWSVRCRQSWIR